MDAIELVKVIKAAAEDKKATNIVVQDLRGKSDICSYQIVCSGTNDRQNQAIANSIESAVKNAGGGRPSTIEGKQTGHWILVDYLNVIVHIFQDEMRSFYALEEIWPSAPKV